jgi:hypothetical protein
MSTGFLERSLEDKRPVGCATSMSKTALSYSPVSSGSKAFALASESKLGASVADELEGKGDLATAFGGCCDIVIPLSP